MSEITVEKVVEAYVKTRNELSELKKSFEEKERELNGLQANRESWLKERAKLQGVEGFKTQFGTTYPVIKESVKVADWDAFLEDVLVKPIAQNVVEQYIEDGNEDDVLYIMKIIREKGGFEFLNKAANKTACLEKMGERVKGKGRPNNPPRGISYDAFETVGVRKA